MNKHLGFITCAMLIFSTNSVFAEQMPAGIYKQTSSNMGDCATCEVKVVRFTPHILQVSGNNGWVGYLHYAVGEDRYRGVLQWESGKGGAYENFLFVTEATYEGKTFTLNAKSGSTTMVQTYRYK